jgi:hypothetical protein
VTHNIYIYIYYKGQGHALTTLHQVRMMGIHIMTRMQA